jgi:hypothetical protein
MASLSTSPHSADHAHLCDGSAKYLRYRLKGVGEMDILEMARNSGMLVMLDARIGREEYHSVSGSLRALQRFADALRESLSLKANEERVYHQHLV